MSKTIAIAQSNFIPWKGYFDLINQVDEFVIFDEAQYTKQDWRNRNQIKTANGLLWLTIPVRRDKQLEAKISQVKIANSVWGKKAWASIEQNYSRAAFFDQLCPIFEPLFREPGTDSLSNLNMAFIKTINEQLGITTPLRQSSEFDLLEGQTQKLLGICQQCGADRYLSGPAARDYFDEDLAKRQKIQVEWMDYSGYPEYRQLYPPFEHHVTILDLLFNEGKDAPKYLKSFV